MERLGINWKILLGQMINFVILLFLLKRFAYKPFLDILGSRKNKIEEGVRKSAEAEKSLQNIRALEIEMKKSGEARAREILKEAEKKAGSRFNEMLVAAEGERKKIIEEAKAFAKKEIEAEKEAQRKELIEKTFLLAGKFLKEKMDKEKDKRFLEKIISEIK